MQAWLMDGYEGVEHLSLREVDEPRPGPGEALLRVRFAGLNPADAFLAQALYPAKPKLPHILGRDGVGDVLALGPDVTSIQLGERVGILRGDTGIERWGTLAEKVVVPVSNLTPIPAGWSPEEMAGAPLVFLTAWQALTQWSDPPAPPPPGSVLLVTGASGGVGTASVLLGRAFRLVVIGLTRSREKAARLRELGVPHVLSVSSDEVAREILAAIAPRRVDLVVDMVGGPMFNELLSVLGKGGRISVVGRSSGAVPEFNTAKLFFRRNRIGGVAVADYSPESAQAAWREIVEHLEAIHQRPIVDSVHRFEDVPRAFERLAEGPFGKVLVRCDA